MDVGGEVDVGDAVDVGDGVGGVGRGEEENGGELEAEGPIVNGCTAACGWVAPPPGGRETPAARAVPAAATAAAAPTATAALTGLRCRSLR